MNFESSDENNIDDRSDNNDVDDFIHNYEDDDSSEYDEATDADIESDDEATDGDNESEEDDVDDYFQTYFESSEKLHPNLNCSVSECICLILLFFLKHNLSWVCLKDLLDLINAIIGKSVLPKSKYLFRKFLPRRMKTTFHFYCSACYNLLENKNLTVCDVCGKEVSFKTKKDGNFFITLPLKHQLIPLIKTHFDHLTKARPNLNNEDDSISDVNDGILYRQIKREEGEYPLTLTLNTDGVRMYKSSNKSQLWPIQYICNELEPNVRFNKNNIGICGFWYGKHPIIEIFFKSLIQEAKSLSKHLIKVTINERLYKFIVLPLLFTLDTIAKDMMQCKIQFNGYCGCSYCLHPGTLVKRNCIRYYLNFLKIFT